MIRFGPARDEPYEYQTCPHCGLRFRYPKRYETHVEEDHRDA